MPLQCFLQLKKTLSKPREIVLKAFCYDKKGPYFVFEGDDQLLERHSNGIKEACDRSNDFKQRIHVDYTMSDEEMKIYICPKTRKFKFRGKFLRRQETSNFESSGNFLNINKHL